MSYIDRDYLVIQFQNFANKIKELLNNKAVSKEAYDDLIIFSNTQPTSKDNKIWIKEETVDVIKILEEEDVLQVVQQGINNGNIEIATDPQVLSDISGIKNGTITVGKANAVGTLTQQNITEAIAGITDDVNELGNAIINGDVVAGNADKLDNHDSSYFLNTTQKGTNNGLAELDENGKVPSSQLPSYVDDIVEYDNLESFPSEGESGKIYIATDTNKTYRWSGTQYVVISETLSLGETSSTAYAGNKGKANADAISTLQNVVSALPSSYAPVDAQKNVQSDWNVSDTNSDAFIKNKPSIPNEVTEATVSGWGFTKNTGTYIKPSGGIPASDLASGVIPTSLPANGGNSDTVDGKNASDFAPASLSDDVDQLALGETHGGKNMWQEDNFIMVKNDEGNKRSGTVIECEPNTTYTLQVFEWQGDVNSVNYGYTDSLDHNATYKGTVSALNTPKTFTTAENSKYIVIFSIKTNKVKFVAKAQLEKGSSASPYEPYIKSNAMLTDEVNGTKSMISNEWDSAKLYAVGAYVIDENQLYQCIVQNSGQKPKTAKKHWKRVKVTDALSKLDLGFFTYSVEGIKSMAEKAVRYYGSAKDMFAIFTGSDYLTVEPKPITESNSKFRVIIIAYSTIYVVSVTDGTADNVYRQQLTEWTQ